MGYPCIYSAVERAAHWFLMRVGAASRSPLGRSGVPWVIHDVYVVLRMSARPFSVGVSVWSTDHPWVTRRGPEPVRGEPICSLWPSLGFRKLAHE